MSKNKAISSYLEDYYWYWFCNIPRIGKTKLRQLLMVFESPEHVYKADVEVLRGLGSPVSYTHLTLPTIRLV